MNEGASGGRSVLTAAKAAEISPCAAMMFTPSTPARISAVMMAAGLFSVWSTIRLEIMRGCASARLLFAPFVA